MRPRWQQQAGGAFIALVGAGGTSLIWHTAQTTGDFDTEGSVLMPAFCVLGLGMIFLRGYKEERLARGEDISRLKGWRLLTPRWWAILVIGLAVGFADYALLSGWSG